MFNKIYLDNNATTSCHVNVFHAMLPYLKEEFANPSSIYSLSHQVKDAIKYAREKVAHLIHAKTDEILFTSCASESNVTAIMSAVKNNPDKKHIITTQVEHASVMETMAYLEKNGYQITYLSVDSQGQLRLEELKRAICEDTFLICVMLANNEIGTIYPIEEIGRLAKERHILFHVDAVQAIGKMEIDVEKLSINTLSISGHKIHAPKGIGALYVRKDIPFTPLIFGHQESNRRGGTENVAYIVGLGEAVQTILEDRYQSISKIQKLRDYMEEEIKKKIENVVIYGDKQHRLPNTSSIAFKDISANELMLLLESFQIFVSTGSACNSTMAKPSHVLVACQADLENYSPIRISLSNENTKEEIDIFVKKLQSIVHMKRRK